MPEALGRCPGGGAWLPERHLHVAGGHICQEIDQQVQAFLARPLESSGYAYVYLDATYLKGRLGKALQVCSSAVVVALGVNEVGRRELMGTPIRRQLQGCVWQRCRVHHRFAEGFAYARNLLQCVPKAHQGMVTAALRSVFAQVPVSTA